MMEDEEDEDVVFEGSAIHQHLLDVGYTDYEQSSRLPSNPSAPQTQAQGEDAEATDPYESHPKWLSCFPHHLFGTVANLLHCRVRAAVAREVLCSRLVDEDDWLLLQHFLPEGEVTKLTAKISFTMLYRDLGVVCVGLSLLWMLTDDWLAHALVFFMAVTLYALYCFYLVWRSTSLKQFVGTMKESIYLMSKSVRLVQEVDLIAKGFVLAQGPGASLATPYEVPPQVIGLSEALLSTVSSAAKVLKALHTLLEPRVLKHPIIRHLFASTPALQESCTFSERKQYLKDQVTVIKLQTSAVMTKLLLWLYDAEGLSDYKAVSDVIQTHVKQGNFLDHLQLLKKQYEYNRTFWLTERPSVNESQYLEEKKKNVYLALHSLALHLQAALVRVQSLETGFERESSDVANLCDPDSLPTFPSYEQVKEHLSALRQELDSCQGCIEEAEARAERKYGMNGEGDAKEADHNSTPEEGEELDHAEGDPTAKPSSPVLLYDQHVPAAEDEVFEAYIDHQEFSREDRGTWEEEPEPWCVDARKERQVLRQQKEQGKRVLKELQPILCSRRRMWEEREKIALEKRGKSSLTSKTHKEDTSRKKSDSSVPERSSNPLILDGSGDSKTGIAPPPVLPSVVNHGCGDGDGDEEEEEEDSDEERLRQYRKVRQELDEDEAQRTASEGRLRLEGEEEDPMNCGQDLRTFENLANRTKELSDTHYSDSDSEIGEEEEEEREKVMKLPEISNSKQFPVPKQQHIQVFSDTRKLKQENANENKRTLGNRDDDWKCSQSHMDVMFAGENKGEEVSVKCRIREDKLAHGKDTDAESGMCDVAEKKDCDETLSQDDHFNNNNESQNMDWTRIVKQDHEGIEDSSELGKMDWTRAALDEALHNQGNYDDKPQNKTTATKRRGEQDEVFSHNEDIATENKSHATNWTGAARRDETFSHNEDINDNDNHPGKIDWTTFRLPTHQTETLEDRLNLFSGGACLGFQAQVAAQASAASRNFIMAAKHQQEEAKEEEIFGGVGEGEEFGFGTDSDQEKSSDGGDGN